MMKRVLEGKRQKREIFDSAFAENPTMNTATFNDLWHHVEEEVTRQDNYDRYMFKPLEGTLWLREVFLMA